MRQRRCSKGDLKKKKFENSKIVREEYKGPTQDCGRRKSEQTPNKKAKQKAVMGARKTLSVPV